MAVCYDKLFHKMIDKRISNAQLMTKAGLSANIVTRLKRNAYVSLESIEKICSAMGCTVDEILEFAQMIMETQADEYTKNTMEGD